MESLVSSFENLIKNSESTSVGLAVFDVLTSLITQSTETTVMGIDSEINKLLEEIQKKFPELPLHFSVAAEFFRGALAKAAETHFEDWKELFVTQARQSLDEAQSIWTAVPNVCSPFLQHGMTILTHGFDHMVNNVLLHAVSDGRKFHVIVTEGRPHDNGSKLCSKLDHPNLDVTVIPDSAVGLWMSEVNTVLIGSDLILEDGSLVANVGTSQVCILASIQRKPVYCVCETFKFSRKFILSSTDLQQLQKTIKFQPSGLDKCFDLPTSFDHTPAKYITLLLTEKGPIPPSAVTHELTTLLGVA